MLNDVIWRWQALKPTDDIGNKSMNTRCRHPRFDTSQLVLYDGVF